MLFLSSAVGSQPGKIPVSMVGLLAQSGQVTCLGSRSRFGASLGGLFPTPGCAFQQLPKPALSSDTASAIPLKPAGLVPVRQPQPSSWSLLTGPRGQEATAVTLQKGSRSHTLPFRLPPPCLQGHPGHDAKGPRGHRSGMWHMCFPEGTEPVCPL